MFSLPGAVALLQSQQLAAVVVGVAGRVQLVTSVLSLPLSVQRQLPVVAMALFQWVARVPVLRQPFLRAAVVVVAARLLLLRIALVAAVRLAKWC